MQAALHQVVQRVQPHLQFGPSLEAAVTDVHIVPQGSLQGEPMWYRSRHVRPTVLAASMRCFGCRGPA